MVNHSKEEYFLSGYVVDTKRFKLKWQEENDHQFTKCSECKKLFSSKKGAKNDDKTIKVTYNTPIFPCENAAKTNCTCKVVFCSGCFYDDRNKTIKRSK